MKYGTISCTCGQEFYFETIREEVRCIKCNKKYSTADYPEQEEVIEEEVIQEETEEGE